MNPRILIVALLLCSCGPAWSDVRRHPDGTYENIRTHECWTEYNEPVQCPDDRLER